MKQRTVSFLIVLFSAATGFATNPSFQGLGFLEGGINRTYASDVSWDGSVAVGISWADAGATVFRWTSTEGIQAIHGFSPNQIGTYTKISADGSTIVGQTSNEAARWTAGNGVEKIGILGGGFSFLSLASGVTYDGSTVVGFSTNTPPIREEAFKWNETDGLQGLGFIGDGLSSRAFGISSDGSVIVGSSSYFYPNLGLQADVAIRWTAEEGMVPLLDPEGIYIAHSADGVSADGSVVIGNGRGPAPWQPFRWTSENNIEPLGFLDNVIANTCASGISGDGKIIVGDSGDRAFIWDEVNGMRSIQDLLTHTYGLDLSGWTLNRAYSTNYDGTVIVGTGFNPDGDIEGWIATIPEPATLSLLALGSLLAMRRKRS